MTGGQFVEFRVVECCPSCHHVYNWHTGKGEFGGVAERDLPFACVSCGEVHKATRKQVMIPSYSRKGDVVQVKWHEEERDIPTLNRTVAVWFSTAVWWKPWTWWSGYHQLKEDIGDMEMLAIRTKK